MRRTTACPRTITKTRRNTKRKTRRNTKRRNTKRKTRKRKTVTLTATATVIEPLLTKHPLIKPPLTRLPPSLTDSDEFSDTIFLCIISHLTRCL
jgi:hypothetical protein